MVKPLDVAAMLSSGVIEGPFKAARPATVWRKRIDSARRALWVCISTIGLLMRANRKGKQWSRAHEFLTVYRLYRRAHGIRYSLQTAWRIAIVGADF